MADKLSAPMGPSHLASPSGLTALVNANGSIRRMDQGDIILNLFLGSEMEDGPANLYLRRRGETGGAIPLLGPRSLTASGSDGRKLTVRGQWQGIRFGVSLVLAESASAWFWHVELENAGDGSETLNLIYAQDLALAHYGAVRLNEYYVSQYVDHTPLSHPVRGLVMASRQNQSMGGRNPWCVIGALGQGVSFATDALQVHGLATRAGGAPSGVVQGLPGVRRQHEHSMAAIQDAPFRLEPVSALRPSADRRHPPCSLRPRRLERLTATGRSGHARTTVQRLDGDPPLPDPRHPQQRLGPLGPCR